MVSESKTIEQKQKRRRKLAEGEIASSLELCQLFWLSSTFLFPSESDSNGAWRSSIPFRARWKVDWERTEMCFRQGKHFQLKIFSSSLRLLRWVESEKNISESQRGGRNEIAFFPFFSHFSSSPQNWNSQPQAQTSDEQFLAILYWRRISENKHVAGEGGERQSSKMGGNEGKKRFLCSNRNDISGAKLYRWIRSLFCNIISAITVPYDILFDIRHRTRSIPEQTSRRTFRLRLIILIHVEAKSCRKRRVALGKKVILISHCSHSPFRPRQHNAWPSISINFNVKCPTFNWHQVPDLVSITSSLFCPGNGENERAAIDGNPFGRWGILLPFLMSLWLCSPFSGDAARIISLKI